MAGWSLLPSDLVRRIGDCLLATDDIDCYMDMRAVCHGWRSATVDPRAQDVGAAAAADPRFRPRNWIMLDGESDGDGQVDAPRLFVNVSTGRFLRRRVPLLRDHILVAASDGLLLLGDRTYPHAATVLNPFTGSLLRFSAPIPTDGPVIASVTNYDPMLVFAFDFASRSYGGDDVMCADPTSQRFVEQFSCLDTFHVTSLVSHAGHAYMASTEGEVVGSVGAVERYYDGELSAKTSVVVTKPSLLGGEAWKFYENTYLVSSDGELLLILSYARIEVLRIDVDRKAVEPVESIGGRALFLGDRCLSVDADMLPSVDGNCIYYVSTYYPEEGMVMYRRHDLEDGTEEEISANARPFSLVQVLLTYCNVLPDVQAQCQRIYIHQSWVG